MNLLQCYIKILEKTWVIPILLAILSCTGLLGALIYEGFIDSIFVLCFAISALSILLAWYKPSVRETDLD